MNSFKKLLVTKSILAAVIAVGGIAAPAVSHAIALGGPLGGMVCRTGYTAAFDGSRLKCSKAISIPIPLICDRPNFPGVGNPPAPVPRAAGAAGDNSGGKDLCPRSGLRIGTTDSLVGLTQGTDYVFATTDAAAVTTRTANNDQAEAAALGLSATEVDTLPGTPSITVNSNGVTDKGTVTLTFFTFAVPGPGIVIGNPGPVGLPATGTSTVPFAPKALPR
jgi:hypothetical protein